jgi:hypothetical protein
MKSRVLIAGVTAIGAAMMIDSSGQAYEVAPVTGGGTIAGKVVYNGDVEIKKIIPTKDTAVCGQPRDEPMIDVGAGKEVQYSVVYLAEVAKGKEWPKADKAPVLDQKSCRFEPRVMAIPAGGLDVLNSDPVLHNTHGYYGKRTTFNLALPNQGQIIPVELKRGGEVRVDCDAHGWMEGWIYVMDNPYFAVTGADGKFSISDVPPGDYKLVAIHPYTGPVEQSVSVAGGQAADLTIELKK